MKTIEIIKINEKEKEKLIWKVISRRKPWHERNTGCDYLELYRRCFDCVRKKRKAEVMSRIALFTNERNFIFLIALDPGLEYDRDIEWTYRYSETAVIAWSENSVIVIDRSRQS